MSKGYRSQPESDPSGLSKNNLSNKISNVVVDYNPKYKMNIRESVLTYIKDERMKERKTLQNNIK